MFSKIHSFFEIERMSTSFVLNGECKKNIVDIILEL